MFGAFRFSHSVKGVVRICGNLTYFHHNFLEIFTGTFTVNFL